LGACRCGQAAALRKVVWHDPAACRSADEPAHYTRYVQYSVPLMAGRRVVGVLLVFFRRGAATPARVRSLLKPLTDALTGMILHKRMEEALRESQERYRRLVETSPDAIFVSAEGRIAFANDAAVALFGATRPADLVGRQTSDLILPGRAAVLRELVKQHQDSPIRLRETITRFDGSRREVEAAVIGIVDHGAPAKLAVVRDVTDSERAREQVFRAEKMAALGQMIAGVAHEINNPNNFIAFNLPLLRDYLTAIEPALAEHAASHPDFRPLGFAPDELHRRVNGVLEGMELASQRLRTIIDLLRDYTHQRLDGVPRAAGSLRTVVERSMVLVGKQIAKTIAHVDIEIEDDLPLVRMDGPRMEQVLINLLVNASHAADGPDSRVTIVAQRVPARPGWVQLIVTDNGVGIPKEIRPRIFEPLFTTKGPDIGTGLGLAIAQSVVQDHGGSIWFEEPAGPGARFVIELPAEGNHR
jgi:PAS domain S-box-containing protein